ncbi:MAG TPA: hypothetical protein VF043_18910 [Ktedonobacteraceae bacterium]
MKRFIVKGITATILVVALAFPAVTSVFAASPGTQGQPGQTCLSSTAPQEPGNASSSPGSPFNETSGHAGSVYAGNGVSAEHANSDNAVSQYDVACFQVSQPHP